MTRNDRNAYIACSDAHAPPFTPEIEQATAVLKRGGLVAFPTETVYGLGADASSPSAVARIFSLKGRPSDHPLIVHLAHLDALERWAWDIPSIAWQIAERHWPGPLTLILKRNPDVPSPVTGGHDTIGLRIPSHPVAHALLVAFGGGIAAPSANRFGRVSPTTAAHVVEEFGGRVDYVLDGGPCAVGVESTILDLSSARPRLLRPGSITLADLTEILGVYVSSKCHEGAPKTPGSLPSHYAPATPVRLAAPERLGDAILEESAACDRIAVMARRKRPPHVPEASIWDVMPPDPGGYARLLYARLREIDKAGCSVIIVEMPPAGVGWDAIRDRLTRAACPKGR